MIALARVLLLTAGLSLLPLPNSSLPARPQTAVLLSASDRQEGAFAAHLAGQNPPRALRWLQEAQRQVRSAELGLDGQSLDIHFMDGAELVVAPPALNQLRLQPRAVTLARQQDQAQTPSPSGRAIVLEPFANELERGPDAGKAEADALAQGGFKVDVLRNSDVSVESMTTLASYSVVYMETHSAVLPDGDAVVVTAATDNHRYASLIQEHSLVQAFVAGDPTMTLYLGITSTFVNLHMGIFPGSSVLFLNGCTLLAAPRFWAALEGRDAATLISWDNEVANTIDDLTAQFVFAQLLKGETVAQDIADAHAAGLGTSIIGDKIAQLGFLGDGTNTLAQALAGKPTAVSPTPTATPSPTPTPTATPTPTPRRVAKCKRGWHLVHGKCRRKHRKL